jgi:hypothetical protein
LARLNHADIARVITTEIPRQNPEKIAETSSVEVSPRNFRGFHTVCKGFAVVFSVEWLLRNGRARQSPGVQEIWHVLGQQEAVRLCFHFGSEIGHGR